MNSGKCPDSRIRTLCRVFLSRIKSTAGDSLLRRIHKWKIRQGVEQHVGGRTWWIHSAAEITWFCFQDTDVSPVYQRLVVFSSWNLCRCLLRVWLLVLRKRHQHAHSLAGNPPENLLLWAHLDIIQSFYLGGLTGTSLSRCLLLCFNENLILSILWFISYMV